MLKNHPGSRGKETIVGILDVFSIFLKIEAFKILYFFAYMQKFIASNTLQKLIENSWSLGIVVSLPYFWDSDKAT